MKFTLKNRPTPTILMTQPYTSSVNIDTLMEKIREWEMFADGFEKELREKIFADLICASCHLSGKPCQNHDEDCAALTTIKEILGE